MSARLRIETAHDDDLRWAVFEHDELRFQLCGLLCPDGSMDLVGVSVGDLTAVQRIEASERLIEQAVNEAEARQVRLLRCNVWDSERGLSIDVLREFGFQPVAALQCWSTEVQSTGPCSDGVSCLPLADGIRDPGKATILDLVAETLEGSLDLSALSTPSPEMLLTTWLQFPDSVLLTAQQDESIAGLAVLTIDNDLRIATLEYIGVAVAFRRQGVAQRLLASACAYLSDGLEAEKKTYRLLAWCDTLNVPAIEFYRGNGFGRDVGSTIWQSDLPGSSGSQSGSWTRYSGE